jgi:hypothetical protein
VGAHVRGIDADPFQIRLPGQNGEEVGENARVIQSS